MASITENFKRMAMPIFFVAVALLLPTAAAAAVKTITVSVASPVVAGKKTTILIKAIDENGQAVVGDRLVRAEIFNGGQTTSEELFLKDGRAELVKTFEGQGASLVTVTDIEDPSVVNYHAFVVSLAAEAKK